MNEVDWCFTVERTRASEADDCVADTSLPQLMHERVSRLVDGICDETTWHLWYLHIQTTEDNNTSTINIKACYSIKEK